MSAQDGLFRAIPSVDRILSMPEVEPMILRWGRARVTDAARTAVETARAAIRSGAREGSWDWPAMTGQVIENDELPALRRVINLSGVIAHTNLGRARLAPEAAAAAAMAAQNNVNLEYSLEQGDRGERDSLVEGLIVRLTGAEAATVVNNNAAAVLLALNTISMGRRTIVSRGELIEIGGSFRLPEVMEKSGAILAEVGTTNRTHLADYENAVTAETALILRAHTSNYKVVGFTAKPEMAELAALARQKGLPLMEDLGSGALVDLSTIGLPKEPTVAETLKAGVDIVTFSGDKLLGGPQAGIIAGRREWVERIRKNPLKRALRPDKMVFAALEATLRLYLSPETAMEKIPTLRHLGRPLEEVRRTAERAAAVIRGYFAGQAQAQVMDCVCRAGAGALPEVDIPSACVAIIHRTMNPNQLAAWFRGRKVPIIGRVEGGVFLLDARTLDDPERDMATSEWD